MPAASLSALDVIRPGPTTARRTNSLRERRRRANKDRVAPSADELGEAALDALREHTFERVVDGDDAPHPVLLVDHREGHQVVLRHHRGDLVAGPVEVPCEKVPAGE